MMRIGEEPINNNAQVIVQPGLTSVWEDSIDRVAEIAKRGIQNGAPALANISTAPCGAAGQCMNPVVAVGIVALAEPAVDSSVGLVKQAVRPICGEAE
jgi:hypothetical protein